MAKYSKTETSPAQVGEILAGIAGFFPNYNNTLVVVEHAYALVHKTIAESSDDLTGKAISSAKADVIAEATPEALEFKKAKAHVENIEMLIGALKFLQKSLEVEYANSNI